MLHKPFSRTDLAAKVTEAALQETDLKLIEEETSHSIGNCGKARFGRLWAESGQNRGKLTF